MIILDTDCLSLLNRENLTKAARLQKKLDEFPQEELFTTIITFEEQMRGWLAFIARCKTTEDEIFAYTRLHRFWKVIETPKSWILTEHSAGEFAKLKSAKVRIGTMDLKIASIAIANEAILVTRNTADFEQVPGLHFEDWT